MLPRCVKVVTIAVVWSFVLISTCNGHGRLIEPPSRASAWRYGFPTPPDYNDHELYCGGFNRQWQKNDGKCGECGDAWDSPLPRPHEYGGKWGQGVIVRKYALDAEITLRVELTASHMGYFEFRVCPDPNGKQVCLDKHVLKILGGTPSVHNPEDLDTRFYPRNGSRIYEMKARLPGGLKCTNCLLQWRYIAGNNWGMCENGTGAVGCGPQEEFRACADISIGASGRTTMRPFRPATKTTPSSTDTSEEEPDYGETEEQIPEEYRYIGIIIAIVSLLLVLCLLAAIYLYHYHGGRVKQLLHWQRQKDASANLSAVSPSSTLTTNLSTPIDVADSKMPPVPPPRTKRLSSVHEISPEESSVVIGQEPMRTNNS
ncbi:unnamed protein product [Hermetia illucens]|uniref:Chitin-binding type-4 domain-containing protein n=1 Tax=Hermetia illucens TaxID=343691 RepID=A0A7R8Z0J6_HERIL|nr:uncharacterized protein LOC119660134 [Hermetia illucens]XP_037924462.1 uncharacterized protein LOC119660134 [Hermetia illucens]XP_037924463.1 uncharacterized protein LOC119660134 [Hermetia illucens]CAD7092479.1 unnamed protein product [Hermetia illucens]